MSPTWEIASLQLCLYGMTERAGASWLQQDLTLGTGEAQWSLTYMQGVRGAGEAEVLDDPVPDVLHQGTVDSEGESEGECEDEGGLGASHVSLSVGLSLLGCHHQTERLYRHWSPGESGRPHSPLSTLRTTKGF